MNQLKRKTLRACACVTLAFASVAAAAAGSYKPDALLSVDLNRGAVVEKIVSAWGSEIPALQRESFKTKLQGLRADHLLSANLSGSFEGVLEVLNAHESAQKINALPAAQNGAVLGNISEKLGADKAKALGDTNADLVYTPITPCRLFDTRAGQASALGVIGGIFSNQQLRSIVPAGACGIPTTGVASLFLSYHAYSYNPAVLGVIGFMKPGDPFSALAGAWTGGVWVTSTYITGTSANGNFDAFVGNGSAMTADMIVDVMGYFRAPQGIIGDITEIQTAAGSGLVGGVTSGAVSLSLANSYKLPQACANAQVPKFNSATSLWECQNDLQGTGAGGTGTVTNIATGAGLTGGPITTTGTIGLAATQLMPTTACASGQVAKWSGTAWACAADASGPTNAWTQGGNAFGAAGVMGTTDAQNLTVQSAGSQISVVLTTGDGLRVLQNAASGIPNVINGDSTNALSNSGGALRGATISGGSGNIVGDATGANGWYGTIGGGVNNRVGLASGAAGTGGTVGGGQSNTASGRSSTVGGGAGNVASGLESTVAGGGLSTGSGCLEPSTGTAIRYCGNQATAQYATVGGGVANISSNTTATISGGQANTSSGAASTVGGGYGNIANSTHSTVAGGGLNKAQADFTTVGGGTTNTATGEGATVAGGTSNTADFVATVGGGKFNNASGNTATIAGGQSNTVSGLRATVGGGFANNASGTDSVVSGGQRNAASGERSSVSGGAAAVARSYGQHARAAGSFILDQNGTAQHSEYILRRLTTDATPTDLKLDGASEDLTMEPGRASLLDIQVIGLQDNFQVGTYTFKCLLQQVAPGNTFLVPAGCNKAIIQEDVAAWDVNVTNTVDGRLKITATGTAGVSIRWVATVRAVEVKW